MTPDEHEGAEPAATAILLAAGRSERMRVKATEGAEPVRKPFLELEGRTVLEHTCEAFRQANRVRDVVLVVHADDVVRVRSLAGSAAAFEKVISVVPGGELRTDSVRAGVQAAPQSATLFAIHDVARLLIRPELIDTVIGVAAARGACVVATPATDTIKTSIDGRSLESTLDRAVLWNAQTPQVFEAELFGRLLEQAEDEGFSPTDDAALHERYSGPVPLVEGDPFNLKLTTPDDLTVCAALLRARKADAAPPR
jgi:2-C-methyl-D-erythritol 4-phosphate cytidylyltransferase